MSHTEDQPVAASGMTPAAEETETFEYLGHKLLCTARPRAGHYEAVLVVQRQHRNQTWERILSTRCGILHSAEAALKCARDHGETWIVKYG